jgi:copper chaperone CopZ
VTTTLRINGMTCNGCVRHVDKALRAVPGVTAVEVTLPDQAKVVGAPDRAALAAAVAAAGYQIVDDEGMTPSSAPPNGGAV